MNLNVDKCTCWQHSGDFRYSADVPKDIAGDCNYCCAIDMIIVIKFVHLYFYKDSLKLEEEYPSKETAEEREVKVLLHAVRLKYIPFM